LSSSEASNDESIDSSASESSKNDSSIDLAPLDGAFASLSVVSEEKTASGGNDGAFDDEPPVIIRVASYNVLSPSLWTNSHRNPALDNRYRFAAVKERIRNEMARGAVIHLLSLIKVQQSPSPTLPMPTRRRVRRAY